MFALVPRQRKEPVFAGHRTSSSSLGCQALVKNGSKRAVEPQDREPTPAGRGLNPVAALHTVGLRRAEVDRR